MGARLALAVWWFWIEGGYLSDGRRWIEALLALDRAGVPPQESPPALPARTKAYLLQVAGILAMVQGDHDRAVAWAKGHALPLEEAIKDTLGGV